MKTGIELIAEERQEQIEKHGRTIENDVKLNSGDYEIEGNKIHAPQLATAASHLIVQGEDELLRPFLLAGDCIPYGWNKEIYLKMINKPYKERLIIAGALIAAEIDRLNNLNPPLLKTV